MLEVTGLIWDHPDGRGAGILYFPRIRISFKALSSNERTGDCERFCIWLLLHESPVEGKSASRSGTAPWGAYLDGDVIVLSRPQLFPFTIALLLFCQGKQALKDRISLTKYKRE